MAELDELLKKEVERRKTALLGIRKDIRSRAKKFERIDVRLIDLIENLDYFYGCNSMFLKPVYKVEGFVDQMHPGPLTYHNLDRETRILKSPGEIFLRSGEDSSQGILCKGEYIFGGSLRQGERVTITGKLIKKDGLYMMDDSYLIGRLRRKGELRKYSPEQELEKEKEFFSYAFAGRPIPISLEEFSDNQGFFQKDFYGVAFRIEGVVDDFYQNMTYPHRFAFVLHSKDALLPYVNCSNDGMEDRIGWGALFASKGKTIEVTGKLDHYWLNLIEDIKVIS